MLSEVDFGVRLQECYHPLWCIAAAIVQDRDLARDVVQDAAIIGLQKRSEFAAGTSFVHWMGQIVRFTAMNQTRKNKARNTAMQGLRGVQSRPGATRSGTREHHTNESEWFDDQTRTALAQLSEVARACVLMRVVLDMPYRPIAEALGIEEGTAMSHVHRARVALREHLQAARSAGGGAHA